MAAALRNPKLRRFHYNNPLRETKLMNGLDSPSTSICQYLDVASRLVMYFAAPTCSSTSSINLVGKGSRWVRPLAFIYRNTNEWYGLVSTHRPMDGRSDWWMAQSSRYGTACPLVDPLPLWKRNTVWIASVSHLASPWLQCGEWRLQDRTALVNHWKHHCVFEWFSTHPDINLHLGAAGRSPGTFRGFPLRP